ncbi:MAG: Uma2 family endonuclease [Caldilineaceae bacterium]
MVTHLKNFQATGQANGANKSLSARVESDDPFRYGYRTVPETLRDGKIRYHYLPLTQADFLDPQEGDHLTQSDPHLKFVISLVNRFEKYYLHLGSVGVFSDLKMRWNIPGLKEPAPDLAIVPGLQNKTKYRGTFDVSEEGARPCLVVEVVSPNYPGDDTEKVDIYRLAGIQEYIVVDPHFDEEDATWKLKGWRLRQGQYQTMQPDAQGRFLSETTGVWFALTEDKRDLLLTDAATGEKLLTVEEEYEARLLAEANAAHQTQRADAEQKRADAAEAEVARLRALLDKRNGV